MNPFEMLRRQAEQRRNEIYREARWECRKIVTWINQLEKKLADVPKPKGPRKSVNALICELMPTDREFTVGDILKLLQDAEPKRRFDMKTVRSQFQYLESTGKVRRTRKASGRVLWAVPSLVVAKTPFGVRTAASVAEEVLRECGPMATLELLVEMRERGYRADQHPRKMLATVQGILYRNKQFRREGKRWAVST